jgi:CheY-like chemotaxis protein
VLVVDDEEFCIASMDAMLTIAGINTKHQVDFCITGKEALD